MTTSNDKWQPTNTVNVVLAVACWLTLFSAEAVANYFLPDRAAGVSYYYVAIFLTSVLCLLIPLLGARQIGCDVQELCLYDVFVQFFGAVTYTPGQPAIAYLILAQLVFLLKTIRVVWPIFSIAKKLPESWPVFGVITFINRNRFPYLPWGQLWPKWRGGLCAGFGLVGFAYLMQLGVTDRVMPIGPGCIMLTVLLSSKRLVDYLEASINNYTQMSEALIAEKTRAVEHAKYATELATQNTALTAANDDLATEKTRVDEYARAMAEKNELLEQQRTELASQYSQLTALSEERATMMADLAERNRSLRDASHDFIIPLLELSTWAEEAKAEAVSEKQATYLDQLNKGLEALSSMMEDIIEQAKVSTELAKPQVRDLSTAELEDFFDMRFRKMAVNHNVWFEISETDFTVHADPMLLRRVISNLINNAILYSEAGTDIDLRFTRTSRAAYVSVRNNGAGMEGCAGRDRAANFDTMLTRIKAQRQTFNRTVHDGPQGHGLGLQIVKRLCDEMGTTMMLYSHPNLGTIFRFKLPLGDKVANVRAAPGDNPPTAMGGQ
jgi:signal transduction histidine kinase